MSYWEFFLFSKTFKFYNNVHHVSEYSQFQDTYSRLGHRSVLFSPSIGELTSWWAKQVLKSSLKHQLQASLVSRAEHTKCFALPRNSFVNLSKTVGFLLMPLSS